MKLRIRNIEIHRAGNKVTAELGERTLVLCDPEEKASKDMINHVVDVRLCGVEGRASASSGPISFSDKQIVAKVVERDLEFAVLDCGLFSFDYLINVGDEDKFVVGDHIKLERPRLDMMFKEGSP